MNTMTNTRELRSTSMSHIVFKNVTHFLSRTYIDLKKLGLCVVYNTCILCYKFMVCTQFN